MKKSISRTEKRGRGRPPTNPTSIHLTLAPGPLAEVDDWIERQKESYTRPEAIRSLIELGLAVKPNLPKQVPAERAARAKELASKTIDSLTVGAPDDDEHATRKRRLIKGPEEFRELRADRAKAKDRQND